MVYSANLKQLSAKIGHIEMAKMLKDLGWTEFPTRRNNVKTFQTENDIGFFQIDLPFDKELVDYSKAIYRAAETLAQASNRSLEQTFLNLLNPASDIIHIQIDNFDTSSGSIFLEDGIKLFNDTKKMLIATTKDILNPQLQHSKNSPKKVSDFVNMCRFGQTEIGSYIITVVCPFAKVESDNAVQLTLFDEKEEMTNSLTRKVVNKLICSIDNVKKAINNDSLENTINESLAAGDCISVNFLETLADITEPAANNSFKITADYSPIIKGNRLDKHSVSINHEYHNPMKAFVQKYRTVQTNKSTYIGKIKSLSAMINVETRNEGKIKFVFVDNLGKLKTATTVLNKEDYNIAIQAHKAGKNVKIIGTLISNQNTVECEYFEVIY
ncbi:MAG: hypothetical protein FWG63_11485 [Defluviitaleaceae bacterium]|nr:hypothetical protein [Defluviitaleaceae bacterium]